MGELLGSKPNEFHASTNLLASDIKFHGDSLSVWLRNPKITKETTGDVVEIWPVPEKPNLDPILALKNYMSLREAVFGKAEDLPLFIHENGGIFTKQQMNSDLSALLSLYPELNTGRDKWTGHCFRSGLSTLLAVLGFKEGLCISSA